MRRSEEDEYLSDRCVQDWYATGFTCARPSHRVQEREGESEEMAN